MLTTYCVHADNVVPFYFFYFLFYQADYAIDGIKQLIKLRAKSIRVKESAMKSYWSWVQDGMNDMVFGPNSSVTGWYRNTRGINWTLYPGGLVRYWWTTRKCDMSQYTVKY